MNSIKPSRTTACLLMLFFIFNQIQAQPYSVYGVSDLVRVFEDGYNLPEGDDRLELFGIRGETISGQFYIQASQKLTGLRIVPTEMKDQQTGSVIPADLIQWNFVGSVPLTENAPNQPPEVLVRLAPARFPDYLTNDRETALNKGRYQAIWLTIFIPESAPEGHYTGDVEVQCNEGTKALSLTLNVFPFLMPEDRHLKITEWYTTSHFKDQHGINERYSEEWFSMLKKYAENMAGHRQNIFQVPMNSIGISRLKDGSLRFDYSRFDQIADVFWQTGSMDYLETGELTSFGEKAWFDTEIVWKEFSVMDDASKEEIVLPGEEVVPYLLPSFENHLRSKGWLDKTLFHVKDEPTLRNVQSWKQKSAVIHKYAPDLVRIDALETTFLFDEIEIAVPKLDYLAGWQKVYEEAASGGTELWFYTVGIYQAGRYPNKTIDMPLIDNRILHWINYRYDLKGFLHWGWNQWHTGDPFEEVGMHIGDGWHVYPFKDGVLNSLRWEQMRNGIQDYEYFWMLESRIRDLKDSLGTQFYWIDPGQRGREICSEVVTDFLHHSSNPRVLYEAKKKVLDEMLEMDRSPLLYIQTNPPVNSGIVREGSYLVEIFGWTEAGTEIIVNGEDVMPDERGMFLRNVKVSRENNEVFIIANGNKGSKEIVRNFLVER